MNLVIVESRSKTKTIQKILGSGYRVVASCGHLDNLPKKELGVDIDHNFRPSYVILSDKKKILQELKHEVENSQHVYIATDKDFEGEKIAASIVVHCRLDRFFRVVFTEITKDAILGAFKAPKSQLNQSFLDCQETRRITDRLIGYKISPILWKCFYSKTPLSIGRVQAATLSLLVDRQQEINDFVSFKHWEVVGCFNLFENRELKYAHHEEVVDGLSREDVKSLLKNIKNIWTMKNSDIYESKSYPCKPFTTSTLQQAAFHELKFPIKKTMMLAQKLYEKGYITYIRTDSAVLSHDFIGMATSFIEATYGIEYLNRNIKPIINRKNAQEAHEAIRPTSMASEIDLDAHHQRLYRLIWVRSLGYLMMPAIYQEMKVFIADQGFERGFHFMGGLKKLIFKGYLILNDGTDIDDEEIGARVLKSRNKLGCQCVIGREKMSESPRYYDESALVKKMESVGIGRPATYQITIDKLTEKNYVQNRDIECKKVDIQIMTWRPGAKEVEYQEKEIRYGHDKNKLVVSELGIAVFQFIKKYFALIANIEFSRTMEEQLDRLIEDKEQKNTILRNFYNVLEPLLHQEFQTVRVNHEVKTIGSGKKKIMNGKYGYYFQYKKKNIPLAPFLEMRKKTIEQVDTSDLQFLQTFPREVDGNRIEYGRYGFYCRGNKKLDCNEIISMLI